MIQMGRILILGASGQLGIELQRSFSNTLDIVICGRERADLGKEDSLRQIIRETCPSVILNAAAYTAVDRAETEPDLAMKINGLAPGILAEEAAKIGALLVHYSTDYVFDGSKSGPWIETDQPAPLNVYGHSKLTGERAIASCTNKYLILRTSWVYSSHGNNFLLTMQRLARERDLLNIVEDQQGAPTSAGAIATGTRQLLEKLFTYSWMSAEEWAGVYHMTCQGSTTWYEFARAIFEDEPRMLAAPQVIGIPSEKYPTPARRPKNSVLNNGKLRQRFGVELPPWRDALAAVKKEL